MEGRRRYGAQVSPERSKVWTEPSPKNQIKRQQGSKVPVVYYLSKNRHLEHPHFIEVPISSPEGLYLRDVMNRLVVLRGKRMPALYSWSCKRSYKNGFVWQDLSEDDIILPALGNEYILKGSELLDPTPQDRLQGSNNNSKLQNAVPLQGESPACSGVPEISVASSSPASTVRVREGKLTSPTPSTPPLDADDSSYPHNQSLSPEIRFPNFGECRVFKLSGAQDASTQTEDTGERRSQGRSARMAGIPNDDDGFADAKVCVNQHNRDAQSDDATKREVTTSRLPSTESSGGKINTLEALIRDEVNKLNSFRIIEEEEVMPIKAKMKRTNALLQLLTCGSTLVKDHHSLGFIPTYKPRFLSTRLSPMYPSSTTLRELDSLSESSRVMSLVHGQRDSFSRTPSESCVTHKKGRDVFPSTNCNAFYHGDISPDLKGSKQTVADLVVSNNYPGTMENFSSKVRINGTFKSPILDARSSLTQQSHCKSPSASFGSKRITDITSSKGSSIGVESFQQDDERTIKIDERLTSGARIIIQSRVEPDDNENSAGS